MIPVLCVIKDAQSNKQEIQRREDREESLAEKGIEKAAFVHTKVLRQWDQDEAHD